MRVIVAGGRDITDYHRVVRAIELSGWEITELVSGAAPGVDTLGGRWAREHGVPTHLFPAEWRKYGAAAGPIRNGRMASFAESALPNAGLILVWDGQSKGSRSMRSLAIQHGLPVFEDRDHSYYFNNVLVAIHA